MSFWRSTHDGRQVPIQSAQTGLERKIEAFNAGPALQARNAIVTDGAKVEVNISIMSGRLAGKDRTFSMEYGKIANLNGQELEEYIYRFCRKAAIRGGGGLGKVTKADIRSSLVLFSIDKDGYTSL